MADEEASSRIYDLIDQLGERVSQIDSQRTSPGAIASALTNQLGQYLSSLVSTLISQKTLEETRAKQPRSILRPAIPIDIVSVSPTAAASIVSALERAGIGKYDVDIKQFDTVEKEKSGGSSLLDGIIKAFGTTVHWLTSLGSKLLGVLGPWAASLIGAIVARLRGGFGRVKGLLAMAFTGMAAFTFAKYINEKNTLEGPESELQTLSERALDDPHSLFRSSPTQSDFQSAVATANQSAALDPPGGIDEYLQTPAGGKALDQIMFDQPSNVRHELGQDKNRLEQLKELLGQATGSITDDTKKSEAQASLIKLVQSGDVDKIDDTFAKLPKPDIGTDQDQATRERLQSDMIDINKDKFGEFIQNNNDSELFEHLDPKTGLDGIDIDKIQQTPEYLDSRLDKKGQDQLKQLEKAIHPAGMPTSALPQSLPGTMIASSEPSLEASREGVIPTKIISELQQIDKMSTQRDRALLEVAQQIVAAAGTSTDSGIQPDQDEEMAAFVVPIPDQIELVRGRSATA